MGFGIWRDFSFVIVVLGGRREGTSSVLILKGEGDRRKSVVGWSIEMNIILLKLQYSMYLDG